MLITSYQQGNDPPTKVGRLGNHARRTVVRRRRRR